MTRLSASFRDLGLLAIAILFGLNVWIANGSPLLYFDTLGYIAQGNAALDVVWPAEPDAGAAGLTAAPGDGQIVGSRSLAYSVALGVAARIGALPMLPLLQLGLTLLTLAVVIRALARASNVNLPTIPTLAAVIAAGSITALPFYVAFLMPDILTSALLLAIATLVTAHGHLRLWETGLLVLVGVFSTLAHASHIPIAGLTALIAAVPLLRRGGASGPGRLAILALIALFFIAGLGERLLFGAAVRMSDRGEVIYQPYLTARLIADGPGLDWLNENCGTDPAAATCALLPSLRESEERRHAARILFDRTERYGSYARLDPDTRAAIANEQISFTTSVVLSRPLAIMKAVGANVAEQLWRNSVAMTLQDKAMLKSLGGEFERFEPGITLQALDPGWQWKRDIGRLHK
ncbi:MAG: hypothetical protein KDE08_16655, partial [Rhodobacteraceae bacterium]|nr:hypothetical protein [Paracoccaceae bacterium]